MIKINLLPELFPKEKPSRYLSADKTAAKIKSGLIKTGSLWL